MAKADKPDTGSNTESQSSQSAAEKPKPATSGSAQSRASGRKTATAAKSTQTKPKTAKKPAAKAAAAKSDSKAVAAPEKDGAKAKPDTSRASQADQAAAKKPAPPAAETSTEAPKSQPDAKPTGVAAAEPLAQGRPFWPFVLGGLVAGAIGFAVAQADLFGSQDGTDALRATLAKQQAEIEALKSAEPVDLSGVEAVQSEFAALAADVSTLKDTTAQMATRLAALEARPVVGGADPDAAAAYAAELAALKSSVETQRSEIETLLQNARTVEEATADAARTAAAQSALARISSAMNSGSSFSVEITALTDAGITDLPEALTVVAADGVTTLANLQSRFPDVARTVLADARAAGGDAAEPGLGGFLKRQLGARSVTPREGSDPDAVLSRADAAVRDGQIANALQEMQALPQDILEAAQDWIQDAEARTAAQTAVQTLSQTLTAN